MVVSAGSGKSGTADPAFYTDQPDFFLIFPLQTGTNGKPDMCQRRNRADDFNCAYV
jgi:hypothetical protein